MRGGAGFDVLRLSTCTSQTTLTAKSKQESQSIGRSCIRSTPIVTIFQKSIRANTKKEKTSDTLTLSVPHDSSGSRAHDYFRLRELRRSPVTEQTNPKSVEHRELLREVLYRTVDVFLDAVDAETFDDVQTNTPAIDHLHDFPKPYSAQFTKNIPSNLGQLLIEGRGRNQ
jgi:hypothetical protein